MVMGSFYVLAHALLVAVPMYEETRARYRVGYEYNKTAIALSVAFWLGMQLLVLAGPWWAARRKIEGRS
jgi:hypothetical protein